jgi:hypothetical protein
MKGLKKWSNKLRLHSKGGNLENSLIEELMNNSPFHEQSTNILNPFINRTKLVSLEVETWEKFTRGPPNIIKNQENKNEMNKKINKNLRKPTNNTKKKRKKKWHRLHNT